MQAIFRLLFIFSVAVSALSVQAAIKINVNAKDGDVISGEFVFKATVESEHLVTQVEFYVGSDLRDSSSSTPYTFRIDTLAEAEGDLKVTFAAYTSEGENVKKTLTVKIDNGLSKGPDFHVQQGQESLITGKWNDAIISARRALKIKPGYAPARVVMARANFGKGVYDAAQKSAEDVIAVDPNNAGALELLAAISLQKAFATVNRGGDRTETLNIIRNALKSAVENRRKVLDNLIDQFGPVTDVNKMAFVDLAIRAGRYSLAIEQLAPHFRRDPKKPAVANRLIYAQLRAGRFKEALDSAEYYRKYGQPDSYGHAILAIVYQRSGDTARAQDEEKEAVSNDPDNLGVRSAQAYLALARGKTAVSQKLAADLAKDEGQLAEVNYYLATIYNQIADFDDSRQRFERAVLTEPIFYDMYVERANEALAIAYAGSVDEKERVNQWAVAKVFFETALVAKPESFEALTGLAVVYALEKNPAQAQKMARTAIAAGPEYAPARYMLSAILSPQVSSLRERQSKAQGDIARYADLKQPEEVAKARKASADLQAEADKLQIEMTNALNQAIKLDQANLEGRSIPNVQAAWQYYRRYGRTPLIVPPR